MAVLGAGALGAAIAARLGDTGHQVKLWNRTPDRAREASTIGPENARTLGDLARTHGVAYLDAPVSGSTGPARNGKLVWLVAGSQSAFALAEPTLQPWPNRHCNSSAPPSNISEQGSRAAR